MVLKLEVCNDADMSRAFEIMSLAFGHELPYIEAVYPAHHTPAGRAQGSSRFMSAKKTDPTITFLKVTDTDTGLMIAQAKWIVYKNHIPAEEDLDGDFWENSEEKEYAQLLDREYLNHRRKLIKDSGGNLVSKCYLRKDQGCV
jgi:hypothetical protein